MPDLKDALYDELYELTQELEIMRTEFMADNVLDDQEKTLLRAMNEEIEALQAEIQALEEADTDGGDFVWEEHPIKAKLNALLRQPHLKALFDHL